MRERRFPPRHHVITSDGLRFVFVSLNDLCFRHQHVDGHDEGKPDQRPAHDCDWWMDKLGVLWIRHK